MTVSAFNTPFANPVQYNPYTPWNFSPTPQGLGINPYAFQQYTQNQPLASAPLGSIAGFGPGLQQLQHTLPLLQIVPQQLQRLQHLATVQLQELMQLQQIVQLLPTQVQQLQQQQQPYGQAPGFGGFGFNAPWGTASQSFGTQPSHVM